MGWVKLPGGIGKVYVPEERPDAPKKHDCKDCFSCQMCSDSRCNLCRAGKVCPKKDKPKKDDKEPIRSIPGKKRRIK